MPGNNAGSRDEVLEALVASLRTELAGSQAALAQALGELAQARERIAELEARLRRTPRFSELGLTPGIAFPAPIFGRQRL